MNATDRIDYARPFTEHVKGTLYARFRLDPEGVPVVEFWEGAKVYTMDVCLLSPRAAEIDEVRYTFDGPGAPEPIGASTDRDNDFRITIESAGDEPIRVFVRIGDHTYEQFAWLSQLLDNGYGRAASPAVRSAVLNVRVN